MAPIGSQGVVLLGGVALLEEGVTGGGWASGLQKPKAGPVSSSLPSPANTDLELSAPCLPMCHHTSLNDDR